MKFPSTKDLIYLSYCSVSPLYGKEAAWELLKAQSELGRNYYPLAHKMLEKFHRAAAKLLRTEASNISYIRNTAEGMSMIANGYPFKAGDEIISFEHEYPSDHYPWKIQERRGVTLKLLSNARIDPKLPEGLVNGWSFDELKSLLTERTRLIALSHVQFTSGFAADLSQLGALCKDRGITLVIDAAQSIGSLPLYPEEYGIDAIAASGWKWLLGPMGTGVLYTSEALREKLQLVVCGADNMIQSPEYLDHRFTPHHDARCFEYGPAPYSCLAALTQAIEDVQLSTSSEAIRDRLFALQQVAFETLDKSLFGVLQFDTTYRSGIYSVYPLGGDHGRRALAISAKAESLGAVITPRDGFLRIAPHYFVSEDDVAQGIECLNRAARDL